MNFIEFYLFDILSVLQENVSLKNYDEIIFNFVKILEKINFQNNQISFDLINNFCVNNILDFNKDICSKTTNNNQKFNNHVKNVNQVDTSVLNK